MWNEVKEIACQKERCHKMQNTQRKTENKMKLSNEKAQCTSTDTLTHGNTFVQQIQKFSELKRCILKEDRNEKAAEKEREIEFEQQNENENEKRKPH